MSERQSVQNSWDLWSSQGILSYRLWIRLLRSLHVKERQSFFPQNSRRFPTEDIPVSPSSHHSFLSRTPPVNSFMQAVYFFILNSLTFEQICFFSDAFFTSLQTYFINCLILQKRRPWAEPMNAFVHFLKDYSIGRFYASRGFLFIFGWFMHDLCIFMHLTCRILSVLGK